MTAPDVIPMFRVSISKDVVTIIENIPAVVVITRWFWSSLAHDQLPPRTRTFYHINNLSNQIHTSVHIETTNVRSC